MDRRQALGVIDATLRRIGFQEVGPGPADYSGSIRVHGSAVDILLSIPDVRFVQRPRIHLKHRAQVSVPLLAHIETETGICYASAAGLPIDMYKPGEAILRVLEEAKTTLERSFAGRAQQEYIDEYQNYWRDRLPICSFYSRSSITGDISAKSFLAYLPDGLRFVGVFSKPSLRGYRCQMPADAVIWHLQSPLGPTTDVIVPNTLAQLERWYVAQPALRKHKWKVAFDVLLDGRYLLLAAPNCFLGLSLKLPAHLGFAVTQGRIRRSTLPSLMSKAADTAPIARHSARWSSIEDIAARNNPGMENLSKLKVALIGCGTIGSHLARYLVQSGAGQKHPLQVFDPELLAEGNLGRHLLNFSDVGKPKASAVADELRRFHPQLEVRAVDDDVTPHLASLETYDLIIDATGDWNAQSAFNDWFMTPGKPRPSAMLYSWIFMNGAGVQSFLNLRDKFACFRCLKPIFDQHWRYPAGNPSEPLNLQPATCGDGAYVPFTVDVSTIAAALANRAALDFVRGEPGYRLRTVVTDINRGRFQKPVSPEPALHCPACAAWRATA